MDNAKIAATWWSNALKTPKFSALSNEERHDSNSAPLAIAEAMASSHHCSPEESKVDIFKSSLCEIIERELKSRDCGALVLSVDYSPDMYLSEALECAGIDCNRLNNVLPWKTVMWINDTDVSVKCGYGARPDILWIKKT